MDAGLTLADWAGKHIDVLIDRPLGTTHPSYPELVMEVNYGYIPGTLAPDGHPIDAYVLGVDQPLERCTAKVIAVIRRRDDVEDKLVTAVAGDWDEAAIVAATAFQERWFDTYLELP
jgi:inorganic pyrophosphatase